MFKLHRNTETKMKFVVFLLQLLICTASIAATPIDGTYSGIVGGYLYTPPNLDHAYGVYTLNSPRYQGGFDAGGHYGYKSNPMRYEAEVTYLKSNIDHFYLDNTEQSQANGYNQGVFGMANIYFDVPMMNPVLQPYLGAGIGYGWVQAKINSPGPTTVTNFNAENSTFAYQGLAGITYNFAENYALSLGYRYLATSHLSGFGEMFQAHIAQAGATYRFDQAKYK